MKRSIIRDRKGANLVEYVVLVGVVALTTLAGAKVFGGKLLEKITEQANAIGAINGSAR